MSYRDVNIWHMLTLYAAKAETLILDIIVHEQYETA